MVLEAENDENGRRNDSKYAQDDAHHLGNLTKGIGLPQNVGNVFDVGGGCVDPGHVPHGYQHRVVAYVVPVLAGFKTGERSVQGAVGGVYPLAHGHDVVVGEVLQRGKNSGRLDDKFGLVANEE